MAEKKSHRTYVRLTPDQFNLARRRLFVEDHSWQTVLSALVNAYIMGDISVTKDGRYVMAPPSGDEPLVQIPKEADLVEIEPEWGKPTGRPQVGHGKSKQRPRSKPQWGTRELAKYLRKETGRRITQVGLRSLLRMYEVEKAENGRWIFQGPEDESVPLLLNAIGEGVYDRLIREGTEEARRLQEQREQERVEIEDAHERSEIERRAQHLKRLRSIEEN